MATYLKYFMWFSLKTKTWVKLGIKINGETSMKLGVKIDGVLYVYFCLCNLDWNVVLFPFFFSFLQHCSMSVKLFYDTFLL